MLWITRVIDIVIHADKYLATLVQLTGNWSYLALALVIFCETGLVVTPFLPGDSFLFAIGALSATGVWHIGWVWILLTIAAILGDSVNYSIGGILGTHIKKTHKLLGIPIKPEHLVRTEQFYAKHGNKAIVIARFIPIIRTFAPFVAGMAEMEYKRFVTYNIVGGASWVTAFLGLGYFFGNLPVVKERFGLVIGAIIVLSFIPVVKEYLQEKRANPASTETP